MYNYVSLIGKVTNLTEVKLRGVKYTRMELLVQEPPRVNEHIDVFLPEFLSDIAKDAIDQDKNPLVFVKGRVTSCYIDGACRVIGERVMLMDGGRK
jgi:hypothetical protein